MIDTFNPSMIILARESRGLTQGELAERIGMSATNLGKIERQDINISSDTVEAIAEQTGYPPHFFSQKGEIIPENLNYRKREVVAQKLITPIHAMVNISRNQIGFLSSILNVKVPILPVLEVSETQTPQKIAAKVRKLWNINTAVIENLTDLLESNGIVIRSFPFETDRVDSRSIITENGFPVIFCNSSLLGDRQRFSLAYELAQLVMHTFNVVPFERDISREANAFAAELLMPESEIRNDFKNGLSIPYLGELKRKWKVSMISLVYRADDLGYLTPNQKRYLVQQFNQLKIRKREPIDLDIKTEQPRLLKRWIGELRERGKLGTAEIAALFYLNTAEFMELYA